MQGFGKWFGGIVALLAAAGAALFFLILPARFDARENAVLGFEGIAVSEKARALHETIPVADLHADTLLWMRDPLKRQSRGQTDLPRFREGGFRLQVFSAVTKSPRGQNYERNAGDDDQLTLLMLVQRWPRRTWDSLYERAAHQAGRLRAVEAGSDGGLVFVRTRADLDRALAAAAPDNVLAGVFGIEGAHALEGDIANLDRLYDQGLRVVGLQHFFDNELGGSLHGLSGEGLTPFGRAVVERAAEKRMIVDVAHSSEAVVRDVLALTDRPVIVSHTGLKGHCDTPRNISDKTMKAVADHGGLVGIGFWDAAVCEPTPQGVAEAIVYAVDFLGAEHVALGSDFDGAVKTPIDASQMVVLTQALMDASLDDETIRAVMGENAVRFFRAHLPQ